MLFDCPKAGNVWLSCSLVDKVNSVMHNNNTVAEIIFALLQELPKEKAEQVAKNLWSLWKSRNLRIWQNTSETTQTITARARQVLADWREANSRKMAAGAAGVIADLTADNSLQIAGGQRVLSSVGQWAKPQYGRLKCNIDAAFSEHLNRVGVGLCIRDSVGNFIKAKTLWTNPICAPDLGEALGLLQAIHWVHELQLSNVDFKMDAKKVVDYFNKGSNDVSEFGVIVDECRRCCNVYFENSKVEL